MRGKPKKGKRAKRRQRRIKRACFEEGPRFSGAKHTETGWADGVFLHHAGRKDFFDTLKSGVGFPTPDFLCGSTARAPVGHNLPFVRSRHQAQGQDCNISVFNRFTQINVVSDLFAGFRYKIEHIEI